MSLKFFWNYQSQTICEKKTQWITVEHLSSKPIHKKVLLGSGIVLVVLRASWLCQVPRAQASAAPPPE